MNRTVAADGANRANLQCLKYAGKLRDYPGRPQGKVCRSLAPIFAAGSSPLAVRVISCGFWASVLGVQGSRRDCRRGQPGSWGWER